LLPRLTERTFLSDICCFLNASKIATLRKKHSKRKRSCRTSTQALGLLHSLWKLNRRYLSLCSLKIHGRSRDSAFFASPEQLARKRQTSSTTRRLSHFASTSSLLGGILYRLWGSYVGRKTSSSRLAGCGKVSRE